jgi:hypothetical protein
MAWKGKSRKFYARGFLLCGKMMGSFLRCVGFGFFRLEAESRQVIYRSRKFLQSP